MQNIDILIHARWIAPVEPANTVHTDHAIAVHEGRIIEILPSEEAARHYRAELCHQLDTHLLIPGLVNAHTHTAMSLFRGLADDLPLMEWLEGHIWPAERRWVGEEFVRDGSQLAIAEMLRGGTTCFNDMYFFPGETARVASDAGIRATVGLIVIDFPSVWASNAEEYLAKGIAVHDQYRNDPLIYTSFAPHAPYTVSPGVLEKIGILAEELDIPVHMHVHETADEIGGSVNAHGVRPLARLKELGLLSPRLLAVHMTQLLETEIAELAACGAHVVHCPESNLKLATGFCPANGLLAAGVNLAIGTDGAASNNDLDMLGEMRTSALLAKGVSGEASALPASRVLEMATLGGAQALGLSENIGSLLPNKAADLVAVDLNRLETLPVYNPVSQLIYTASREQVSDVWIGGRHVLKGRTLTTLDETELRERVGRWQTRINKA